MSGCWTPDNAANIAELDSASMHLFEQHHGDMMRVMGYCDHAFAGRGGFSAKASRAQPGS
jgi:hypothetical protein